MFRMSPAQIKSITYLNSRRKPLVASLRIFRKYPRLLVKRITISFRFSKVAVQDNLPARLRNTINNYLTTTTSKCLSV